MKHRSNRVTGPRLAKFSERSSAAGVSLKNAVMMAAIGLPGNSLPNQALNTSQAARSADMRVRGNRLNLSHFITFYHQISHFSL